MQGLVQSGFNAGTWDDSGIVTSAPDAAAGLTTIAVASGAQLRGLAAGQTDTFAGHTITAASTIATYTYAGDANLDGFISADDYSAIDFNVGVAGCERLLQRRLQLRRLHLRRRLLRHRLQPRRARRADRHVPGVPGVGGVRGSLASTASPAPSVTLVPEPACIAAMNPAAAGLLVRRRRRRASLSRALSLVHRRGGLASGMARKPYPSDLADEQCCADPARR